MGERVEQPPPPVPEPISGHLLRALERLHSLTVNDSSSSDPDNAAQHRRRGLKRTRWFWTSGNIVLAVAAIWSFTADFWEAFITLFLASALLQLLWMKRHISEL